MWDMVTLYTPSHKDTKKVMEDFTFLLSYVRLGYAIFMNLLMHKSYSKFPLG